MHFEALQNPFAKVVTLPQFDQATQETPAERKERARLMLAYFPRVAFVISNVICYVSDLDLTNPALGPDLDKFIKVPFLLFLDLLEVTNSKLLTATSNKSLQKIVPTSFSSSVFLQSAVECELVPDVLRG